MFRSPNTLPHSPTAALRGLPYGALFVLFFLGFGIFLPTGAYEFVSWDDAALVVNNKFVHGLSLKNLGHIFTTPVLANYLPLQLLSYQIDYEFFGLDPRAFHLFSAAIHGLNTVLLGLVLRRLGASYPIAIAASILFAVPPAHVESVAWISGRKDLLALVFTLLCVLAYERFLSSPRTSTYLLACVSFLAAVLSKVTVILLPVFLIALGLSRTRGTRHDIQKALVRMVPFAAVGIPVIIVNRLTQVTAQASYAHDPIEYISVKAHAFFHYAMLLIGTGSLQPVYDTPAPGWNTAGLVAAAGLVLAAGLVYVTVRWASTPVRLCLLWILIMLLPALLFPLVPYRADRYLYAPSAGFCLLAVMGLAKLAASAVVPPQRKRMVLWLGVAALAALFAARTCLYLPVWRDSSSLWNFAIETSHSSQARHGLAMVRLDQGRYAEAETILLSGREIPNVALYRQLAAVYLAQGRSDDALEALSKSAQLHRRDQGFPAPANWAPGARSYLTYLHLNRGAIQRDLGRNVQAIEYFERALALNPKNRRARNWLKRAQRDLASDSASPAERLPFSQPSRASVPAAAQVHDRTG